MQIVQVKIEDLKPADYNPRKWDDKMVESLKASIVNFGLVDPLVVNSAVNRQNIVIGGHFRLHVAKLLGFTEVPVVYVDIPEETRERELNLRLNKNLGQFDADALANFDQELLAAVGWSTQELEKIFNLGAKEDDFVQQDEQTTIQKGDLYILGKHRLICGDATDEVEVAQLMDGQLANLIFTDPPYMVDYKSPGGLGYDSKKFGGTGGKIFNDNLKEPEALEFYVKILKNLYNFSQDNAPLYWWFANRNNYINRKAWRKSGWQMSQIIIWLKNSMIFSQGQDYHRCYEPCMFGWKQKKKHYSNKVIANYKDVFSLDREEYQDQLDVWFENRDITQDYIHPTQKPVRRAERALRKSSEAGGIVLDFFGGSGSTLMACEQMDRRCFVMELDPKYCQAIINRWQQFTGEQAKKYGE
jgi:DNA modification methylase